MSGNSPDTSRVAPTLGLSGTQLCPTACQQEIWQPWAPQAATLGSGCTHQQTNTSSRTSGSCSQKPHQQASASSGMPWASAPAPTNRLTPAPGHVFAMPHPPAGQCQLWDTLDPTASWPRIQSHSPGGQHQLSTPWNLQPTMSETSPIHQQANSRSRAPKATTIYSGTCLCPAAAPNPALPTSTDSLCTRQGLANNWNGGQSHLPDQPQ